MNDEVIEQSYRVTADELRQFIERLERLDSEKRDIVKRIGLKKKAKINVQRFKGLGEMNPLQLRETTMARDTRRLVRLSADSDEAVFNMMDMLLAKKRAPDRRSWLEQKGHLGTGEIL